MGRWIEWLHQFCKIFLRSAQIWMRNPRVAGFLWPCVAVRGGSVVDDFFWVLYIKVLRRFMWVDFLWNLVRNFRNPGWESAGFVELVAILVYIVVLMLAALTGGWLRLDLRVKREMMSHHFQTSVQTFLTLSAFEFAKYNFELHKPLYKAIRGMHWVIQA